MASRIATCPGCYAQCQTLATMPVSLQVSDFKKNCVADLQLHPGVRLSNAHNSLQLAHSDWHHWGVALILPGRCPCLQATRSAF